MKIYLVSLRDPFHKRDMLGNSATGSFSILRTNRAWAALWVLELILVSPGEVSSVGPGLVAGEVLAGSSSLGPFISFLFSLVFADLVDGAAGGAIVRFPGLELAGFPA